MIERIMKKLLLHVLIVIISLSLLFCHEAMAYIASVSHDFNFRRESLNKAVNYAKTLSRIKSLLIIQNNKVILDEYFNSYSPDRITNIKSAAKSILSILTGIAIQKGYIKNVDEKVIDYLGNQYPRNSNIMKQNITIRNLLTMTSGLDSASRKSYGGWVNSDNWIQKALSMPMISNPGDTCFYSTSDTHILSSLLSKAIKGDLLDFANENLFHPLEIKSVKWEKDPQGIYFGGNDLYMTPNDLAKLGILVLNEGKFGKKRIVNKEWIEISTQNFVQPDLWSPLPISGYGYLWWLLKVGDFDAIAAWGHAGQYMILIPAISIIVVITSDANAGYSKPYYRSLAKLFEIIFPSISKNVKL